ncbi:MAG: hypothetical protein PHY91_05245 [Tissierellia bacterium]|nr:hypothetical protein [Tissierellia bacterium]MDD4726360.1 hypothetical protein [Tissierellia bacterium]
MLNSIIHMITDPNAYIVYLAALIISIFLKYIIEKKMDINLLLSLRISLLKINSTFEL